MFGLYMQVDYLRALMESADPVPHSTPGLFCPVHISGLGGSRFDLFAITPSRGLRNLFSGATSCGSCSVFVSLPAFRRAGQRSSGRTPGHGPTRPRPCAASTATTSMPAESINRSSNRTPSAPWRASRTIEVSSKVAAEVRRTAAAAIA